MDTNGDRQTHQHQKKKKKKNEKRKEKRKIESLKAKSVSDGALSLSVATMCRLCQRLKRQNRRNRFSTRRSSNIIIIHHQNQKIKQTKLLKTVFPILVIELKLKQTDLIRTSPLTMALFILFNFFLDSVCEYLFNFSQFSIEHAGKKKKKNKRVDNVSSMSFKWQTE